GSNQQENLEIAITLLKQILKEFTRQRFPKQWAMTQGSLGLLYSERVGGNRAENLDEAIACFEQSLQLLTPQNFPQYCADMQNNIARTYRMRIYGESIENKEKALDYYEQALQIITPQTNPIKCRTTGRRAGQLAMELGKWESAERILLAAIESDQLLNQVALSKDSREMELSLTQHLYTNAAFCLVHNDNLEKAVEILEAGRARQLRESLERNRRNLDLLIKLGFEELYTQFLDADRVYQELIIRAENEDRPDSWQIESESIRNFRNTTIQVIREQVGKGNPDFRYFFGSLPFEEILGQAQSSPLIYLFASESGGMALLVNAHHVEVIDLPALTAQALKQYIGSDQNENNYLEAYNNRKVDKYTRLTWLHILQSSTIWMWNTFMSTIIQELGRQNISKAVFVPFGLLGVLPLHAAA
ncbi:MAG TPA: hypothetical protein PLL95_18615, partial [Anaerolineales bacterium]|nr:hypothetical protein [Anaerolineales bacterium]